MATSNKEENTKKMDKIGDVVSSEDNSEYSDDSGSVSLDGEPSGTLNKPSMFCKSCFLPYSGVQKSGTFVLKCQGCGLTDTIEEGQASSLDKEEFTGNLVMNRFFQVLRATENVNCNVGDPDFTDDNFKGVNGAMEDFCVYLNCMSAKLVEIARAEKCEMDENMSQSGRHVARQRGKDDVNQVDKQSELVMREEAIDKILAHRDSVVDVIAFLIEKHNLPEDIWASLENRLDNPKADGDDSDEEDNVEDGNSEAANKSKASGQSVGISGNVGSVENNMSGKENEMRDKTGCHLAKQEEREQEDDPDDVCRESETIFGTDIEDARATLKDEILVKLRSKFDLGGKDEPENESTQRQVDDSKTGSGNIGAVNAGGNADVSDNDTTVEGEITKLWETKFTVRKKRTSTLGRILDTLLKNTNIIRDTYAACRANSTENQSERKDADAKRKIRRNDSKNNKGKATPEVLVKAKPSLDDKGTTASNDDEESGGFEVNFHDVSQAFVDELQHRKKDILVERKAKARAIFAAKIKAIRQQVADVEETMMKELDSAFKEKEKKAKKQDKNLTETQKEIENLEKRLNYYIATGQHDKVAEIGRIIELLNQKN